MQAREVTAAPDLLDTLPIGLRHTVDLDGMHFELSTWQRPWTERLLASPPLRMLANGLLVVGAFMLFVGVALDTSWPGPMAWALGVGAVLWALLMPKPGAQQRCTQRLDLSASRLVASGNVALQLELSRIGRVEAIDPIQPVLVLRIAGRGPVQLPMQLEPHEHAVWLATYLEARGREARDRLGNAAAVPDALLQVQR